jgi:putative ABC transport system permease protein
MMAGSRATNKAMFWRIIRRLFGANPGRLFVMLLALGAGAAVTAALLNLQVDAKRRLTTEFRVLGANIVVAPPNARDSGTSPAALLSESVLRSVEMQTAENGVVAPFLFLVAHVRKADATLISKGQDQAGVVIAGTSLDKLPLIAPGWSVPRPFYFEGIPLNVCFLGQRAAQVLNIKEGDSIELFYGNHVEHLEVIGIVLAGGAEDSQIFVQLATAQRLAGLNGQVSLVQISYSASTAQIQSFLAKLTAAIPQADVRPITQFTEGEAKIYNRISGLLTATVAIVLLLTGLCVMAAMTNVAMERKIDVGLMKAIGGSMRRVLRLFLAEAALLGLAGGIIGAAAGIFLSIGLGKAVFGVAARPRLIVYPVAVALTVIVAILSAFPLRRLASIRPASVFRGEA